ILGGGQGPRADMVLLNAAAAIHVGGKAHSLEEGLRMARDVHRAGTGLAKLEEFVKATRGEHGPPR
ncbi:MAG: anthranilate phosphoribosyltransferase, partial [Halobacteriales archaeon]|nr:anthranilate phosphoribosyltransferase [Halobacteriales archaeon]